MSREIVLPVKCSTVRRLDEVLQLVWDIEAYVMLVIGLGFYLPTVVYSDRIPANLLILEIVFIIAGAVYTFNAVVVHNRYSNLLRPIDRIYAALPTLSCIRDEGDEKDAP